jgi:hypothetical protein
MSDNLVEDDVSKADFRVEMEYEKASENPSRVFRSMSELIDSFQEIDRNLVTSIDVNIEPILLLEDIEAGSIKVWLSNMLKLIPDDAYYQLLTQGKIPKGDLIRKSFQLLLEREAKESILRSFNLQVIKRYFPEYEEEMSSSMAEG